jgi:uncharacterized membrane protein YgcG
MTVLAIKPLPTSLSLVSQFVAGGLAEPPFGFGFPRLFPRRPVMGSKLYVGNLSYGVTDAALQEMFAAHGSVQSAQVIMDRDTGRSKGFGFVEMGNEQEARAAIAAMNGKELEGRALTVNEARPKEGGRGGSGGGGGRGYGGGGGGGGGYGGGGGGRRY